MRETYFWKNATLRTFNKVPTEVLGNSILYAKTPVCNECNQPIERVLAGSCLHINVICASSLLQPVATKSLDPIQWRHLPIPMTNTQWTQPQHSGAHCILGFITDRAGISTVPTGVRSLLYFELCSLFNRYPLLNVGLNVASRYRPC